MGIGRECELGLAEAMSPSCPECLAWSGGESSPLPDRRHRDLFGKYCIGIPAYRESGERNKSL